MSHLSHAFEEVYEANVTGTWWRKRFYLKFVVFFHLHMVAQWFKHHWYGPVSILILFIVGQSLLILLMRGVG